jgi:hypothetical protein
MSEWRQFKLSSADFLPKEEDDCYIPEDDPVWGHMGANKIKSVTPEIIVNGDNSGSKKAQIMREQNIQPGTEAWFKLWFSKG